MTDAKEKNKYDADIQWFRVFQQLFRSGEVAALGPHTFTIYCTIKSFVAFDTGEAFPSVKTISEQSGISERQVKLSLSQLEERGYLVKRKEGRSNVYTLREKIVIAENGKPVALTMWDYVPKTMGAVRAELQNFLMTGDASKCQIIHIEKLIIENPVIVAGDLTLNVATIENKELREKLMQAMERAKSRKEG